MLNRCSIEAALDILDAQGVEIDRVLLGILSAPERLRGLPAYAYAAADLLTYRARCCNPIRGEQIVGYVTRGKGVAVHAKSCPNVSTLLFEADRRIAVEWAKPPGKKDKLVSQTYPVKLGIYCDDRFGMLKQITAVISDAGTNIRNIDARTGNLQAEIDVIIDIEDMHHLERIVGGLRKIPGVTEVDRVKNL